jgi:hypothetical protein
MNLNTQAIPAAIGAAFGGGFFAGLVNVGAETYALIVSPKQAGEYQGVWNQSLDSVAGAEHYSDGMANTAALATAGSEMAQWARSLNIDGFSDWYIPARDELEILYRALKPTADENAVTFRDGDNPSSAPVGYPYTETAPAQTSLAAFQQGGAEALAPSLHWSSTQYAGFPNDAWGQYFDDGLQGYDIKSCAGRARAVRRLKI